MLGMDHETFTYTLGLIEKDITPNEPPTGGGVLRGVPRVSHVDRLTVTLRFLATGQE